jgi:hypothetical protein
MFIECLSSIGKSWSRLLPVVGFGLGRSDQIQIIHVQIERDKGEKQGGDQEGLEAGHTQHTIMKTHDFPSCRLRTIASSLLLLLLEPSPPRCKMELSGRSLGARGMLSGYLNILAQTMSRLSSSRPFVAPKLRAMREAAAPNYGETRDKHFQSRSDRPCHAWTSLCYKARPAVPRWPLPPQPKQINTIPQDDVYEQDFKHRRKPQVRSSHPGSPRV